jgi:hypothetical protein
MDFWQNEVADRQWHFRFAELGLILLIYFARVLFLKLENRLPHISGRAATRAEAFLPGHLPWHAII